MSLRKLPFILLALLASSAMICRCGSVYSNFRYVMEDGNVLTCTAYEEQDIETGDSWLALDNCSLPCPNGSPVTIRSTLYLTQPNTLASLQKQYCPALPPPTDEPTEAPPTEDVHRDPPDPTDEPPGPVLAGSVSACDIGLRFINFPLANPLPDLTGKSVSVFLNGSKVNCRVAGSNNQLLACTLPQGTVFPVIVSVTVDGLEVNNFSFDGAICANTRPTEEPDEGGGEEPASTEPAVDCEINPDPFQC